MRSAAYHPSPDGRRAPLGRRAIALLLVLSVHVLLVILLFALTPRSPPAPSEAHSFTLLPVVPKPTAVKAKRAKRASGGAATRSTAKATAAPVKSAVQTPSQASKPFATELFDAVDIAALPNHRGDHVGEGIEGTGAGKDSGSVYGPGGGPGGEPLYNAEWYTEPTHAELAYYLPHSVPQDSWAMIACRTIEKNHVDDCRELDESPPGSGLSRALRQAAWQFRVLPPRIGGHALVGAWVRIRIDFTESGLKP